MSSLKQLSRLIFLTLLLMISSCSDEDTPTGGGNLPPNVTITSPVHGSEFYFGEIISFEAVVIDPEDGEIADSSVIWISDNGVMLGVGKAYQTSSLSIDSHLITVVATDSKAKVGRDTVTVIINPNGL